ncbi:MULTISPECIES: hypothetical protein [unclassified Mesorhizobium]|uniref:lipopolysaccharide biosynthesis protein n=1 Tax=unclassified Mesorhizobium TaxID=325217 RepID=UPI000FD19BCE|nr:MULTISPECIES: hypothetical protein [unclassified Mesorhizobium]RUV97129.1 hypothetical protein EOA88_01825 [Mesorhizobium sp. M5C.F.Ca.IN.020.14.1.1]RUV32198.1 hypothetical protein EOA86_03285 [Mesorhizobium sp. M5C.F.Ca.IN.020.32.2.1]RWG50002.1 MAG: hypothetical protein EOQ62_05105 [Mesorhizobium sp.]RWH50979.1 MAG: hypothetical protein EOQ80_02390 [Mesorhizobium sp.]RWH58963.1 MAG: hypothetical protein EOQ82_03680 [Mesorhizobium sp.]
MVEQISMPTLQLLLTAPLIYSVGLSGYGLWTFNLSLAGVLGAATPGVGMAATQLISAEVDRTKRSAAISLIVFGGLAVSVLSGGIAFALSSVALRSYPPLIWTENHIDIVRFVLLAVLTAIALQWDMICAATLRAQSRFKENALCEVSTRLFSIGSVATAGMLSFPLTQLLVINLLCIILRGGVKAFVATRGIEKFSLHEVLGLLSLAVHYSVLQWVNNVSSLLYSSADRIVLGYFVSAEIVAVASLCGEMNQQIQSLPRAYFSPILPELIKLDRANDKVGFQNILLRSSANIKRIIIMLSLASIAFGPPLVILLSQSSFIYQELMVIYCSYTLSYVAIAMIIVPYFSLIGRGELRFANMLTIGGAVANLVAAVALGSLLGAAGVALGRMFYTVPFIFWRKRESTRT